MMGLLPAIETIAAVPFTETENLSLAVAPERVKGVDVSRYQGKMDWAKCASAGAKFSYMRCTLLGSDNVLGEDWEWERNSDLAPQHMQGIGAYHVIRPTKNGTDQADFFLERYSKVKFNLPVWMDAEKNEANATPMAYADIAEDFCDEIISAGYDIMPYTRADWWNNNIAPNPLWSALELCIARYTSLPEPWGNIGDQTWLKPRDWSTWRFWQFSADGNGQGPTYGAESAAIDLDYFNGNQIAFDNYLGVEIPMPTKFVVTANTNAIAREFPALGKYLAIAEKDKEFDILETDEDSAGAIWHRIGEIQSIGWVKGTSGIAT